MLSTMRWLASEIRDHEGFLWDGRFGSLYLKLWRPTFSAFYLRRANDRLAGDPTYRGPIVGFRVGFLPKYVATGVQASIGGNSLAAGLRLERRPVWFPRYGQYRMTPRHPSGFLKINKRAWAFGD